MKWIDHKTSYIVGQENTMLNNWVENNKDYGIKINPDGPHQVSNNVFLNNSFWHTSQGTCLIQFF